MGVRFRSTILNFKGMNKRLHLERAGALPFITMHYPQPLPLRHRVVLSVISCIVMRKAAKVQFTQIACPPSATMEEQRQVNVDVTVWHHGQVQTVLFVP